MQTNEAEEEARFKQTLTEFLINNGIIRNSDFKFDYNPSQLYQLVCRSGGFNVKDYSMLGCHESKGLGRYQSGSRWRAWTSQEVLQDLYWTIWKTKLFWARSPWWRTKYNFRRAQKNGKNWQRTSTPKETWGLYKRSKLNYKNFGGGITNKASILSQKEQTEHNQSWD